MLDPLACIFQWINYTEVPFCYYLYNYIAFSLVFMQKTLEDIISHLYQFWFIFHLIFRPQGCWSWIETVWSIFCITFVELLPTKSRSPCNHLICYCALFGNYVFDTLMHVSSNFLFYFFFLKFKDILCMHKFSYQVDFSFACRYQNADWRLRPLPDEMLR